MEFDDIGKLCFILDVAFQIYSKIFHETHPVVLLIYLESLKLVVVHAVAQVSEFQRCFVYACCGPLRRGPRGPGCRFHRNYLCLFRPYIRVSPG